MVSYAGKFVVETRLINAQKVDGKGQQMNGVCVCVLS